MRIYTAKRFVCYLYFVGIENISFGITVNWILPNFEIHLPFCFIRIGWVGIYNDKPFPFNKKALGYEGKPE